MAYGDTDPETGQATNPITSFILPPPQRYAPTNAQMQMRRNVALAMMKNSGARPYPKTLGEGLTSLGQNIADIAYMRKLDAADQLQAAEQEKFMNRARGGAPAETSELTPAQGAAAPQAMASANDSEGDDNAQLPTNAQPTSFFPTAEEVPQQNPTLGAASVSQPDVPGGPQSDQRLALNTYTDPNKPITDIAPAPPVPSSIAKAPVPVQVAQAANYPPEYNIPTAEPRPPKPPGETPQMRNIQDAIGAIDDPQKQAQLRLMYDAAKEQRDRQYGQALAKYNLEYERWKSGFATAEELDQKRIPKEALPGAAVPQNVLNTPQSPQRSGRPSVPPMPASGVSQAEWSKFVSEQGQAAFTAYQKASPTFGRGLDLINQVRNSPYLDSALALSGEALGKAPGPIRDVRLAIDQLKAMNFLQGYQDLRGGGPISNVEGDKATSAKAQLDAAQTPEAFRHALNNLEQFYREDYATIQRRMNLPVSAYKLNRDEREAPDIGTIVNGKVYEGGNPHDPNNWRKVR